jgi:hypothetical protein
MRYYVADPDNATLAPPRSLQAYPRLRLAVMLVWGAFLALCAYRLADEPFVIIASAAVIATVSLIPAFLWASGFVPGLPVLPVHVLTLLWTYALPLTTGHPGVAFYGTEDYLIATACVTLYAAVATSAWALIATRRSAPRQRWYVIPEGGGFVFLVASILFAGIFVLLALAQVLPIDPGLFSVIRASILALSTIAMFVLSVRMARDELGPWQKTLFLVATAFYIVMQIATIFLVGAIIGAATALIGYTIGKGRVPWATILATLLLFGFLHNGKSEMRDRYWSSDAQPIALHELPVFFGQWIAAGARAMRGSEEEFQSQTIFERVSLMHLLLFAQRNSPDVIPFLQGDTYVVVPRMLIPRIFDPEKPHSHLGTAILNVHYGIQSEEDTERTTVGWGLLNEGFANFGIAGVAAISALIGVLFGLIGRLTALAPVMSLENMIGVTFAVIALQSEFTMGVFATVTLQSLAVLLIMAPVLRQRFAHQLQ